MSVDSGQHNDGWDRQESLVLSELRNLRLSSDAALKIGGELKEEFGTFKATLVLRLENQQKQIDDLRARVDGYTKWASGIIGGVLTGAIVAGIIYMINHVGVK